MKKSIKLLSLILSVIMIFSAVSVLAYASEDTQPYRISCTVNGDTKTRRGFCWYTKSETDTVVMVYEGTKPAGTLHVVDSAEWNGGYYHKAIVEDLKAGTTYSYKVGDGTTWSDMGTFTTDNGDSSVSFIAIADVQASSLENFKKGSRALTAALEMTSDVDFVVNLGDYTNDCTNEEWDAYDTAFGALNLTYTAAAVAGNHDGFNQANWFNNMFCLDTRESVQVEEGVNYSYDVGNCHFAVLNTNDGLSITNAQLTWLRNDLNSTDKDWKIIFMHKSPFTLGKDGKWPDALYLQNVLVPICDDCDVDLVMSGHDHMYLRTKALKDCEPDENGTTYVLSGTAGSKRYEIRTFLADTFIDKTSIANLCIQRYDLNGNRWNAEENDWYVVEGDELDAICGSVFNIVRIDGGTLTLNSYVIKDEYYEDGSFNFENTDASVITNIDTFTKEKEMGTNSPTYTGDNVQTANKFVSFFELAKYALFTWLPKFFSMLPELLHSLIYDDVF